MFVKYLSGGTAFENRHTVLSDSLLDAFQKGVDLKAICLRKRKLMNAIFNHVDFSHSLFWGSFLNNVQFSHCTIRAADFKIATLKNVVFQNCNLSHSDFRGVCLKGTDFDQSNLSHCKFNDPNLFYNTNFMNQNLLGAKYFTKDGDEHLIAA